MITLHANAKVHANDAAKAAIVRMYDRQHSRHAVPMLAVEDDLPQDGLLTYAEDPNSYYFDRDAYRSFFYCSSKTGSRVPVRLQMTSESHPNGTASSVLVIRHLPADGKWY